jgi:glycosyltransferase involved in cell wall biosynthesis
LLAAGAKESQISVVPYGVDLPEERARTTRDDRFHVLFVGSGLQRKGLHHLLLAWQRARLPLDSVLTLVCRVIEPALLPMIGMARGVELIRGAGRTQLERLYGSATLFAMPSLIEGFGQVYLEALSFGLPVLGTRNTCLPDLGDEKAGIFCVDPGDIEQLTFTLERLSQVLPEAMDLSDHTRQCAARFSWGKFRSGIAGIL